ncbi:MAG: LysR family transcriptional regulator [Bacteroidales bacterium]|nr:LysR family transcriptional regulator [Candidatus Sodaliphilus limicaballi]
MELKHLRSFVMVADTSSFSIAATRCYTTQPAISQHIKALEEELDCQLIIRTSHDVTLTENGEALLPRAKEILKQTEDCKEHIHALNNCITGELRLGVGQFIAPYIRHAALIFMERYPNVRINAEFGKACRLNQMLREHKIDMAFTMNTPYKEEGIDHMPAIPFKICTIMGDTHPLAKKEKLTFDELLKHNVIMPDIGERVFHTIQKYMKEDLAQLKVKAIVNSASEALNVLEDGHLITFLPKLYIKNFPTLTSRPVVGLDQEMMSNAHWMKDVPLKRSAELFLDIIREETIPYISAME